jgi:hypothetical protein
VLTVAGDPASGVAGEGAAVDSQRAQWLADARYGVDWLLPQAQTHWARVALRDAVLPWVQQP